MRNTIIVEMGSDRLDGYLATIVAGEVAYENGVATGVIAGAIDCGSRMAA